MPDAMTDAHSVTTLVMGDRLPWPDDAWPADDKGPFDSGAIQVGRTRQSCSIRKISALGVTVMSRLARARSLLIQRIGMAGAGKAGVA